MNRLIFSAIGVILTFTWIVYTAPGKQNKDNGAEKGQIKQISRSKSASLHNFKSSTYRGGENAKTYADKSQVYPSTQAAMLNVKETPD